MLAVQVENEMGLGGTDRDYSEIACADYAKPLPEALLDVELADCGARDGSRTWRGHFGRHAHEAFCAWYHARYIGRIAERGRAVYGGVKLLTNVMVGEGSYEEAGHCYNSGAAVGRMIPIWKKGARRWTCSARTSTTRSRASTPASARSTPGRTTRSSSPSPRPRANPTP